MFSKTKRFQVQSIPQQSLKRNSYSPLQQQDQLNNQIFLEQITKGVKTNKRYENKDILANTFQNEEEGEKIQRKSYSPSISSSSKRINLYTSEYQPYENTSQHEDKLSHQSNRVSPLDQSPCKKQIVEGAERKNYYARKDQNTLSKELESKLELQTLKKFKDLRDAKKEKRMRIIVNQLGQNHSNEVSSFLSEKLPPQQIQFKKSDNDLIQRNQYLIENITSIQPPSPSFSSYAIPENLEIEQKNQQQVGKINILLRKYSMQCHKQERNEEGIIFCEEGTQKHNNKDMNHHGLYYYQQKAKYCQGYLNNLLMKHLQLQNDYEELIKIFLFQLEGDIINIQSQNLKIQSKIITSSLYSILNRKQNQMQEEMLLSLKKYSREQEQLLQYQHEQITQNRGNLRLFCRIKPIFNSEQQLIKINSIHKQVVEVVGEEQSKFFFDSVFDTQSSQEQIFQETKSYVQCSLNGDQVCLIAYGQTGSGKTFTLEGAVNDKINFGSAIQTKEDNHITEDSGIISRTASFLFKELKRVASCKKLELQVGVIEIYCEEIRDLLQADESIQQKLVIVKQQDRIIVRHQLFKVVTSIQEMLEIFQESSLNRVTDKTTQNSHSSRSHCIYHIRIFENDIEKGGLKIVDLAGSESYEATSNKKESAFINKSLITLKRIINILSNRGSSFNIAQVPYRESKLTRLLQDGIGGNSKTLVFVMVCPSEKNLMQSKESLKFLSKASLG